MLERSIQRPGRPLGKSRSSAPVSIRYENGLTPKKTDSPTRRRRPWHPLTESFVPSFGMCTVVSPGKDPETGSRPSALWHWGPNADPREVLAQHWPAARPRRRFSAATHVLHLCGPHHASLLQFGDLGRRKAPVAEHGLAVDPAPPPRRTHLAS